MKVIPKGGVLSSLPEKLSQKLSVLRVAVLVLSVTFTLDASSKTLIFESSEGKSSAQPVTSSTNQLASVPNQAAPSAGGASQQVISEMYFLVEQLKQEVQELRGLVEEQGYQLQNLDESGKRRYKDLDQRLLSLSKKLASANANQGATQGSAGGKIRSTASLNPQEQPVNLNNQTQTNISINTSVNTIVPVRGNVLLPTAAEKAEYDKAYALVKDKKFEDAIDALHDFVEKYPDTDLAGNAYYWLGEVYLVIPKLEQAKQSFLIVLNSFPQHRKLPDSIFKLAVTYDRLLDADNSEKYLKLVQQKFPNSTASKLASNYKISR